MRSLVMVGLALSVLASAHVSQSKAFQPFSGSYNVKGTLSVIPKSNEGPGTWSISATLTVRNIPGQKEPLWVPGDVLEKKGTLTASGLLGPVSVPNENYYAPKGAFKISWADGSAIKGTGVITMTPYDCCGPWVVGMITSPKGARGVIILPLRHSGDKISGVGLLAGFVGSGPYTLS
jgi:hypothetical protein